MLKALISGDAGYFPAPVSKSCGAAEKEKLPAFF
jgi:hypothetical protein